MCGIAGFSLVRRQELDPGLVTRVLLAGIAERGDDAAGYAYYDPSGSLVVHKHRGGASGLIRGVAVPQGVRETLIHVREHTKGSPDVESNNHPISQGSVVGIHNGRFANDDELFSSHGLVRAHPEMTVDSAALFALLDAYPHRESDVLEALQGAMAAAWLDVRHPHEVGLARGLGRPLALGLGSLGVFFASTVAALDLLQEHLGLDLEVIEVPEGTFYSITEGTILYEQEFAPQLGDVPSATVDPPSPSERERCLSLLSASFASA